MTQGPPHTAPAGAIHDLGYSRYNGIRLGTSTRFLVIARYALRAQWRQLAVKLFLIGGLMCMGIGAVVVGFAVATTSLMRAGGGAMARGTASLPVTAALGAQWVPMFLLVLVCGAPSIAADLNAGAFQFHFARPVSAVQYLMGRMIGAIAWATPFAFATMALYCVEPLAFQGEVGATIKLLAVGSFGVTIRLLTLGAVALGCSSLTRRRGLAQAMFAALVFGTGMLTAIVAGNSRHDWVAALSVMGSSTHLCEQLLGNANLPGAQAVAPSLAAAAWITGSLALAWRRVARAEVVRG